jgi:hypothetical protein
MARRGRRRRGSERRRKVFLYRLMIVVLRAKRRSLYIVACLVDIWIEAFIGKSLDSCVQNSFCLYSVRDFNRLFCDISTIYKPTGKTNQVGIFGMARAAYIQFNAEPPKRSRSPFHHFVPFPLSFINRLLIILF